jgi:hypothetical protein
MTEPKHSKGLNDENAWPIPAKFRASLDPEDKEAHERLIRNDSEQADLATRVRSPFTRTNPREMHRSKAMITIQALRNAAIHAALTPDQSEQLAEAYALVGRYDLASETTLKPQHRKVYEKYWDAVFLNDEDWCKHPARFKFIKDRIWSIRDKKEVPMMECNICHTMNALDDSEHLADHRQSQTQHRGKTSGMSIQEAQAYHANSVKKNSSQV